MEPRSRTTTTTFPAERARVRNLRRWAQTALPLLGLDGPQQDAVRDDLELVLSDVDLTWRRVSAGQVTFFHAHRWNFHGCSRRR
ncbi:hypothetical protein ACFRMQ_25695, partial [Kitasatospora sp. NPDC056783]|uniref:hypothetical protein n=1 Tax=Kitasatospora sp. NPDC056783 TaxID=3345943 RepID=UPI0036940871